MTESTTIGTLNCGKELMIFMNKRKKKVRMMTTKTKKKLQFSTIHYNV